MKTSLLTAVVSTLLAGTALASPGKPVTPRTAAPADAPAKPAPSVKELFGDIVQSAWTLEGALNGPRVACRADCIEWKEVCSRSCELWNQDGTCGKWSPELVCYEKCVKWSPC